MLLLVGAGVYLYLPRGSNATADNAATVAVLNTAVDAQKGSSDFAPALDGDVVASGDALAHIGERVPGCNGREQRLVIRAQAAGGQRGRAESGPAPDGREHGPEV